MFMFLQSVGAQIKKELIYS